MVTIGATWHHRYRFYNTDGDLTDPDTVVGWVKQPDGTVTAAPVTITQDTVGVYDVEVDVDTVGLWFLKLAGLGADVVNDVREATICVTGSSVA